MNQTDIVIAAQQEAQQAGEELVSIKEASKRLGINPGFISRWVAYGWVPVVARGPRGAKLIPWQTVAALASLREREGRRGRRLLPRSLDL